MRPFFISVAALAIVAVSYSTALASPLEPIRFTAPFAFQAGKTLMPAGTYIVQPNDEGSFMVVSGPKRAILPIEPADPRVDPGLKTISTDEVLFVKKAGQYALLQIWNPNETDGVQVETAKSR